LSSPDAQRIADLQQQLDTLYAFPDSHRKAELEAEIKKLKAPETATAQPKAERAVKPAAKKNTK
jgi:hypothetical protein